MDISSHNRKAWNKQSKEGSCWCEPVSTAKIQAARAGNWHVILTPNKPVPRHWLDHLVGAEILCLASGGGQQAPILAAAGAKVTSFDNSDEQLAKDTLVADREGLPMKIIRGDMADLSVLKNESFDLIFHPVSNVFAEHLQPVWDECFRVLKPNGRLVAGFMNPMYFLFDHEQAEQTGTLQAKYTLPYSDLKSLSAEKLSKIREDGLAYEFGHTLEQQMGGQLKAGFVIIDLYEDNWNDEATPLNKFGSMYISTLAKKVQ